MSSEIIRTKLMISIAFMAIGSNIALAQSLQARPLSSRALLFPTSKRRWIR
jgi:hypothetical protein